VRIPVEWLKEYVPSTLPVGELAVVLTDVGLEVEAIEETAGVTVLDITVTPNRGDCLSVAGVARELAMALREEIRERTLSLSETGPQASELATVVLEDVELCPRYSARMVRQVRIGPSPTWAQQRLSLCGLRPINNVVDATNLVMLELGQPLHAFDYRLVRSPENDPRPQIIVRRARAGERLATIDGETRELTPEILVIADPGGAVALAGIMGGSSTEIHEGTAEVLLESAHFSPRAIRRGARLLGMATEASYRFERTVDPGGTVRALERACELIAEFCEEPVEIARGVVDAYPQPIEETEIPLRAERANALLGTEMAPSAMASHLRRLQLAVKEGSPIRVRVPTFRQDLKTEIDLIEEVARAEGYQHIPEHLPAGAALGRLSSELAVEVEVRAVMRGLGLSEAVTSSLESPEALARLGLPDDHPLARPVVLSNAKTRERSQLRTTLLTSLLDVVAGNRRQGINDVSIFDLGRVYWDRGREELPEQPQHVGVAGTGLRWSGGWAVTRGSERWDFYALKAVVEGLLESIARKPGQFVADEHPSLQPGRGARVIVDGRGVGYLGEVRAEVRDSHDLPDPVWVAEMDLDLLRKHAAGDPRYEAVSRYPAVNRDVALVVPREVPAQWAERVIQESAGDDLESLSLFDAYEGPPLAPGERNLAFSLTFRRKDRTLTDEEVDAMMAAIRESLRERLEARIRE
jgi:phenylalanyl-tRNA synthetase beta chain